MFSLWPRSRPGTHSPQLKMQSMESHTSPMLGRRVNERTSGNFPWRDTSGPDYLLIYCLFTLETVPSTHPKEQEQKHAHQPNTLQTTHSPACSGSPRVNPQATQTRAHRRTHIHSLFLSLFCLISVNSEFPSLSETPDQALPVTSKNSPLPGLPLPAGCSFPPADGDRRSQTTRPKPHA